MKKIIAEFKSQAEVKRLRTIMKNVYASKSEHLPDITRFNLNKIFTPNSVEKAELHITTNHNTDIVTIAKASLTYLAEEYPFTKISHNSEEEAKYIVLPWDLTTGVGQDNLKNLISRIRENTISLKYIIFVKTEAELNQSITSLAGLNLSGIMAEDETEGLLTKIDELELKIKQLDELLTQARYETEIQKQLVAQKQNEAVNLSNQLNTTNSQKSALQNQLNTANNNYNSQVTKYNQLATTSQAIKLNITNTRKHNVVFGDIMSNSIEIHGVKITPASGSFTINNITI